MERVRFCFPNAIILILILVLNSTPAISGNREQNDAKLFDLLVQETREHKQYLTGIGLGERAKSIDVFWFDIDEAGLDNIPLDPFSKRTPIPQEVLKFNADVKNTLITTDPNTSENKPEDITKILDIRLYPALRKMISKSNLEIFLGSKQEMAAYYSSKGAKVIVEFAIPSSATYYVIRAGNGDYFTVMSGLVGRENLIAQLLTLKLAGIKTDSLEIIGDVEHLVFLMVSDFEQLDRKLPELKLGNHVLVVAGCGMEHAVSEIIHNAFKYQIRKIEPFTGTILSLVSTQLDKPINGIKGVITLNLNYGEISEKIVRQILEQYNIKYVFSGGAAGYISAGDDREKPEIGSRIPVAKSMNEGNEVVTLSKSELVFGLDIDSEATHLQIPSIFLETYDWLYEARKRGSSVDVETFYIVRAIRQYNIEHPDQKVKADCGCFISDFVGEQPLREYSSTYRRYPEVLTRFLNAIFKENPEILSKL